MRCWLVLTGLLAGIASGAEGDMRFDWREECRLALSGAFLAQRSEAEMLRQNRTALKERISGLEKALVAARREADLVKTETSRADYDPALAEREMAVKDRVHLLETQLKENETFAAETETKYHALDKSVSIMEGRLKKVFKIERAKTERREPVLSYLKTCPRFEAVCPLPADQRKALLQIIEGDKPPLACERYAQIRT